jgi:hypothetical protein
MTTTIRTGTIKSMDATRSVHTTLLVRELTDGSVEYLIGDSARRRDGWAEVPAGVAPEIRWDEQTPTDDELRELRANAERSGDAELCSLCECALGLVTLDIVGMTPGKARCRIAEEIAHRG